MNPHHKHQSEVWTLGAAIILIAIVFMASCTPKAGCYSTKGMPGYGTFKR